jgi:membrane protease YdiL (CAAX protease family)
MTWVVAAVVLGALPPLVTALVLDGSHPALVAAHAASTIADIGGPLAAAAYTLISGPLSEEFGWRGYLQPRLRARHRRLTTTLIIGTAWGVWHLPLFFLQGTGQHDMGLWSSQGLLFFVSLFPLSYTFLFVSEQLRGGVWAAVLLHASWNLTDALMPSFGNRGAWWETGMTFAVAAGAACVSRSRHR